MTLTDQDSKFKDYDLQISKINSSNSSFAMAHQMALVKMTMGTANAVTTITYDGNTRAEKYRSSGTTSTTSKAVFDNFTPLTQSSTYYIIVKPNTAYSLNSGYKVTTTETDKSPVYQWTQTITNSELSANDYKSCAPEPVFRNFARLYSYKGTCQTFTPILANSKYIMECWGARGGKDISQKKLNTASYGKGGYVRGTLSLTTKRDFYVYVGGVGGDCQFNSSTGRTTAGGSAGWNGGGAGSYDERDDDGDGGGGGATDIRLTQASTTDNTKWNDFSSLKSRIMVAGGGGGSGGTNWYGCSAGCGGNTTGGYATYKSSSTSSSQVSYSPGTQTSGYEFGVGQTHTRTYSNIESAGGGGGYYGGCTNTGSSSYDWAGCGGSSFISGYSGCNAIKEGATTGGSTNHTGNANHYSGYVFTDMNMTNGATSGMPNPNEATLNTSTTTGNDNSGFARITCTPYD